MGLKILLLLFLIAIQFALSQSSLPVVDCLGVAGGNAVLDHCHICNGDDSLCTDCFGVLNGTAKIDECGVCSDGTPYTGVTNCGPRFLVHGFFPHFIPVGFRSQITVYGVGFNNSQFICLFDDEIIDAQVINSTHLTCNSPNLTKPGQLAVSIRAFDELSIWRVLKRKLVAVAPPIVSNVYPITVNTNTAASITVVGSKFTPPLSCVFAHATIPAILYDQGYAICDAPKRKKAGPSALLFGTHSILVSTPFAGYSEIPPSVEHVVPLEPCGRNLTLSFDSCTDMGGSNVIRPPCDAILDRTTVDIIGKAAVCQWADERTLVVYLSQGTTVKSGSIIKIKSNTIKMCGASLNALYQPYSSGYGVVTLSNMVCSMTCEIRGPNLVSACSTATVSFSVVVLEELWIKSVDWTLNSVRMAETGAEITLTPASGVNFLSAVAHGYSKSVTVHHKFSRVATSIPIITIFGGDNQIFERSRAISIQPHVDVSNCVVSPDKVTWHWTGPISTTSMTLEIPACSFDSGTVQTFVCHVAVYANGVTYTASRGVNVTIIPTPLVALISGGSERLVSGNWTLDASPSYDPDQLGSLEFEWSCPNVTGWLMNSSMLQQQSELAPGDYRFTVLVKAGNRVAWTSVLLHLLPYVLDVSIVMANTYVTANDKLVLSADAPLATEYNWTCSSIDLSSTANPVLVISPHMLVSGRAYTICVDVADAYLVGRACTTVHVRMSPSVSALLVSPTAGFSLNTTFSLSLVGVLGASLRTRYGYIKNDVRYPLNARRTMDAIHLDVVLPTGQGYNSTLTVFGCVSDVWGSETCVNTAVVVQPSHTDVDGLTDKLSNALAASRDDEASSLIAVIADDLNNNPPSGIQLRQQRRKDLLVKLNETSIDATAGMRLLASIATKPLELDRSAIDVLADVSASMSSSMTGTENAHDMAVVLDALSSGVAESVQKQYTVIEHNTLQSIVDALACGEAPFTTQSTSLALRVVRQYTDSGSLSTTMPNASVDFSLESLAFSKCVDIRMTTTSKNPYAWNAESTVISPVVTIVLGSSGSIVPVNGLSNTVNVRLPAVGSLCSSWDEVKAQWSSSGISVTTASNYTTCHVTHLTSFALLDPAPQSPPRFSLVVPPWVLVIFVVSATAVFFSLIFITAYYADSHSGKKFMTRENSCESNDSFASFPSPVRPPMLSRALSETFDRSYRYSGIKNMLSSAWGKIRRALRVGHGWIEIIDLDKSNVYTRARHIICLAGFCFTAEALAAVYFRFSHEGLFGFDYNGWSVLFLGALGIEDWLPEAVGIIVALVVTVFLFLPRRLYLRIPKKRRKTPKVAPLPLGAIGIPDAPPKRMLPYWLIIFPLLINWTMIIGGGGYAVYCGFYYDSFLAWRWCLAVIASVVADGVLIQGMHVLFLVLWPSKWPMGLGE